MSIKDMLAAGSVGGGVVVVGRCFGVKAADVTYLLQGLSNTKNIDLIIGLIGPSFVSWALMTHWEELPSINQP